MRWHYVFQVVGILSLFLGLILLLPLAVEFFYGGQDVAAFAKAVSVTLIAGILLIFFFRSPPSDHISPREGMAIVALSWMTLGALGALPFYFGSHFSGFSDALFESVSGFTTTGASILTNIEALSKGMLFWRSLIQWVGGMGIIVLSLAVLPFLGVGGMQLYKAEVPSPVPDKLKPRIRDTALILWKVYILFSAAETLLLVIGGMDLFDALCHTFTTLPTGGFSTKNSSVAHFNSVYIDAIITLFMVLAGINFTLHFQLLRGRPLAFWRDSECRFFIGGLVLLSLLVSLNIYGETYTGLGQALRYGIFQVVSILTTTGFATADYEMWPALGQVIILFAMFLGGSAGSTGGGMKCLRVMLCFKYCYRELFKLIHPRAVSRIRINGNVVPDPVMNSILGFMALYLGLFALGAVLLAAIGVDFVTALTSVASSIGNIGPAFGSAGPVENYAHLPLAAKWVLIWCMLLGRLEIYTVIVLLVPEFWRK
ncbi:MAG: TrkH family potassium uptake protein [Desulfobacterales bacterium]